MEEHLAIDLGPLTAEHAGRRVTFVAPDGAVVGSGTDWRVARDLRSALERQRAPNDTRYGLPSRPVHHFDATDTQLHIGVLDTGVALIFSEPYGPALERVDLSFAQIRELADWLGPIADAAPPERESTEPLRMKQVGDLPSYFAGGWLQPGSVLDVPPTGIVLGRGADSIPSSAASRRHVRIEPHIGGLLVTDLDSTQGTAVNDMRLRPSDGVVAKVGDRITLSAILHFEVIPAGDSHGEPPWEAPFAVWFRHGIALPVHAVGPIVLHEDKVYLCGRRQLRHRNPRTEYPAEELGLVTVHWQKRVTQWAPLPAIFHEEPSPAVGEYRELSQVANDPEGPVFSLRFRAYEQDHRCWKRSYLVQYLSSESTWYWLVTERATGQLVRRPVLAEPPRDASLDDADPLHRRFEASEERLRAGSLRVKTIDGRWQVPDWPPLVIDEDRLQSALGLPPKYASASAIELSRAEGRTGALLVWCGDHADRDQAALVIVDLEAHRLSKRPPRSP